MESVPDWMIAIEAAGVLGCKPWELEDVNPQWITWALNSKAAKNEARRAVEGRNRNFGGGRLPGDP